MAISGEVQAEELRKTIAKSGIQAVSTSGHCIGIWTLPNESSDLFTYVREYVDVAADMETGDEHMHPCVAYRISIMNQHDCTKLVRQLQDIREPQLMQLYHQLKERRICGDNRISFRTLLACMERLQEAADLVIQRKGSLVFVIGK